MMFNDIGHKDNLKKEATKFIKTYEVLKNIGPDIKVEFI